MLKRLQAIASETGYSSIMRRGFAKIKRESHQLVLFAKAARRGTYVHDSYKNLAAIINPSSLITNTLVNNIPREVMEHYLNHRFDLLGAGWVHVTYGMHCRGLENHQYNMGVNIETDSNGDWLIGRINASNLSKAQQIWRHVDADYKPIDWQLDFKSGFRWSEKTWSKKIKFGHKAGVDVKVPWELARMQHLPQLALACLSDNMSHDDKCLVQAEFKNEILDFIALNPPGYGVNWVCPMDIAIRAANWLLAWDIFKTSNAQFQDNFEEIMATSICEHGLYIVKNLEWTPNRANHYLANIAGLTFIAAYLPSTEETDAWLAFAIQELRVEVGSQFHSDGGNVEGSTAYHRLSAEMVYFATAVILGLSKNRQENLATYKHTLFKHGNTAPKLQPAPIQYFSSTNFSAHLPFSNAYFERLERMAEFVIDITKPDGSIPQIGDNDSGRFFKLNPIFQIISVKQAKDTYSNLEGYSDLEDNANYFVENHLNCNHIVSAASGMFDRVDFYQVAESSNGWDAIVVLALSCKQMIQSQCITQRLNNIHPNLNVYNDFDFKKLMCEIKKLPSHQIIRRKFNFINPNKCQDIKIGSYPEFGLYVFKARNLYISIRCWTGGLLKHTSHRHQDQLSVELTIDGCDIFRDPGTYLYTPIASQRHAYRSRKAHNFLFTNGVTPGIHSANVFGSLELDAVKINYIGVQGFAAEIIETDYKNQLVISLMNNHVEFYYITYSTKSCVKPIFNPLLFSPGYGIIVK